MQVCVLGANRYPHASHNNGDEALASFYACKATRLAR